MFKSDPLSPNGTNTITSQHLRPAPLGGIFDAQTHHQVLLANLHTLLPAQSNVLSTYESKVKNKVIITTKDQKDDNAGVITTPTMTNNYNVENEDDDIFHQTLFRTKNKRSGKPTLGAQHSLVPMESKNPFEKKKKLPARSRKEQHLHQFPKNNLDYTELLPVLHLFQSYLMQLIGTHNIQITQIEDHLLRLDFHGAPLSVIKATNPQLVGQFGIVLKETQKQFIILTPKNKVLTLPKRGTHFHLDLSFLYPPRGHLHSANTETLSQPPPPPQRQQPPLLQKPNTAPPYCVPTSHSFVTFYGDQLLLRPHERITRKFKSNGIAEMK